MRKFADRMAWAAGDGAGFAIDAAVSERLSFIRRTYVTLTVQLCAVAGLAAFLANMNLPIQFGGGLGLISVIGLMFVLPRLLAAGASKGNHILGATLCVLFYGLICAPLAYFVPGALLLRAAILTGCVFGGLTAYVFMTKKDFSFLGGILSTLLFVAIGFSLVSFFFGGFGSGTALVYSGAMVLLFSGFILYDTSKIMRHYPTDMHIPAATMLLIDVVILFRYILYMLMASND